MAHVSTRQHTSDLTQITQPGFSARQGAEGLDPKAPKKSYAAQGLLARGPFSPGGGLLPVSFAVGARHNGKGKAPAHHPVPPKRALCPPVTVRPLTARPTPRR